MDSFIEIINKLIENYLRTYINLKQRNWVILLQITKFGYNNSFNYLFKVILFKYIYRYNPEFYIDVGDAFFKGEILSAKEQVEIFKKVYRKLL